MFTGYTIEPMDLYQLNCEHELKQREEDLHKPCNIKTMYII